MMKSICASLVLALAACGGAAGAGGGGSTAGGGGGGGGDTGGGGGGGGDVGSLTIRNGSSYMIYEMHLSPSDEVSWGADLLGGDPLLPGEGGSVPVFQCAMYDLRLVDDEGAECIVNDINLCFNDEDWTIDDSNLAMCAAGWGQR